MRRGRNPGTVLRSKLTIRDLTSESLAGILQRPIRTAMTMLGTVLGVGSFVAVIGLTATAGGQISSRFNELVATEVVVAAAKDSEPAIDELPFPEDADSRASNLLGVRNAGVAWPLPDDVANSARGITIPGVQPATRLPVLAASAGFLQANRPTAWTGRLFDSGHDARAAGVVVLGVGAAEQLGVHSLTGNPAIFIDDVSFSVIGILNDVERNTELLSSIFVPRQTVEKLWGAPKDVASVFMRIDTELGAATTVAEQIALALRPEAPTAFAVTPPPNPKSLQNSVNSDLRSLFLVLAGICLLIGAVGIANTTLVAVLERLPEIGLRRSLGARPAHIIAQVLTEASIVGTLGGLLGAASAVVAVLAVAIMREWTPLMEPILVLLAPLLGTATGVVAGLYPALRAGRVEPVEALQR